MGRPAPVSTRASRPVERSPPQYADRATKSPLDAQEAYAFWIAGFVLLAFVVGRAVRHPPPPLRLRPTAAQVSTLLAWLIIAGIVVGVLLTHRG